MASTAVAVVAAVVKAQGRKLVAEEVVELVGH